MPTLSKPPAVSPERVPQAPADGMPTASRLAPRWAHCFANRQLLMAVAHVSLAAMLSAKQSSVWRALRVPAHRIRAWPAVQVLLVPQLILPRINSSKQRAGSAELSAP